MNKTSDGLSKIDLHMDQKQALFLKNKIFLPACKYVREKRVVLSPRFLQLKRF